MVIIGIYVSAGYILADCFAVHAYATACVPTYRTVPASSAPTDPSTLGLKSQIFYKNDVGFIVRCNFICRTQNSWRFAMQSVTVLVLL